MTSSVISPDTPHQSAVLDRTTPVYKDVATTTPTLPPFNPLADLERVMDQMVDNVMEFR